MHTTLVHLMRTVDRIDPDNLYQAVAEIKEVLAQILEQLDKALPIEGENG